MQQLFTQYQTKNKAVISQCGRYRYNLARVWDSRKPKVLFVMLNPSTADADIDDPTIRRCRGFAMDWGFGGLDVVNLFAFRATDPKSLLLENDPIGRLNLLSLTLSCISASLIICAWGNEQILRKIDCREQLKVLQRYSDKLHCLELSIFGIPKHPLYLSKDLRPQPFVIATDGLVGQPKRIS